MWDCFEPRACDVHCSAHFHVKETFHKLLGRNVDIGARFKAYITRLLKYTNQDDHVSDEDIEKVRIDAQADVKVPIRNRHSHEAYGDENAN